MIVRRTTIIDEDGRKLYIEEEELLPDEPEEPEPSIEKVVLQLS